MSSSTIDRQAGLTAWGDAPNNKWGQVTMRPTASMSADCIQAEDISGAFPLSPTQAGMLFHSLFAPEAGVYLEQIIFRIDGDLDVQLFENSWQRVVDHHEILRTSFRWEGLDRPLQIVHPRVALPFQQHDWRELPPVEQESRLESFVRADRETGFDFSQSPLMRLTLVRLAAGSYRLIWTNHHALLDGWSQSLILKQVFSVYRALAAQEDPSLEPSPPYRNYIDWLAAQDPGEAERFWKQSLKGLTAPTSLVVDRFNADSRSDVVKHEELELRLPVETTAELQAFARKHRLTMFTLVQGAWALLLGRYSRGEDVVFGTTVSVRPHELPDIESAAGLFINTIPVRARLPADADLLSWFKELQLETVEAREHQHSSLLDIQRWSELPKGTSLFGSILVFENYPTGGPGNFGPEADVQQSRTIVSRTNYPLTLLAFPGAELQLNAVYDSERFERETIGRMLGHLRTILAALVADPTRKLAELPLLTTSERKQLLVEWNQTEGEYEKDRCVYQLFEKQAANTPNAIAVEFEEQRLTYGELNTRANQLAHYLRRLGVGPESLVGICIERSLEMVVGLLGILKAGGAYVPLDPAFPKERLAFMIEDANVPVLLTQQKLTADLPAHQAKLVCMDSDWEMIACESEADPSGVATSDNLAYVIYTSGSTGKPKGVQIEHRALTNFLCSVRREPGLGPADVLLSVTTLSFDIAALELYLPLIVGARLVIVSRDVSGDGDQLKARLVKTGATVIQATPATWRMLIDAGWRGSRKLKVLCGGEALSGELADQLRERSGSLWNMYGPTETTIWSSVCKVESGDLPVSIGRPLANTQVYLLDPNLNPVPIGVPGELHIGGDGLARGYLNRPELTREKFIRHPFSRNPQARLYKTGDLARYLPDGNIECLGRIDDQVKLRGFRIELGEIESVLHQHATVSESVVVAREDAPGDRRLVAYVVPANNAKIQSQELRRFLLKKLPEYMIPSVFVGLEELPLTPNGKVNRRALPAPEYDAQLHESYVAPLTPVEELLCGIWAEVLKVSRVGVNDNFFELGGHSLLATQVVSRVLQTFAVQLPLRALFEAPTVGALADRIHKLSNSQETAASPVIPHTARQEVPPLSFAQKRLWFLDQLEGASGSYNLSRAVRMTGRLNVAVLQQTLSEIVSRHESLRTNFELLDEEPVQAISPPRPMEISLVDLGNQPEGALQELIGELSRRPFDLTHDQLLRASLLQLDEQDHVLLLTMHHVVSDGWSMSVLFREIAALYEAFVNGQTSPLVDLPIQYRDFAFWQRDWLQGDVLKTQVDYWKKQLAGAPAVLELPTDRPRPPLQTFNGALHSIVLPGRLSDSLSELSRQTDSTLFMTLLAAFQTLLCRYTNQEDIVLGTPIANRTRRETEDLIGFFVNTLVMRTDLSGNPAFSELLRRVREVALQSYAHQDLPFEKLVEELKPERSLSHMPLFQVMVAFENAPEATLALPGLELQDFTVEGQTAKFDLSLYIGESNEGLRLSFEYNTDLFNPSTIEQIARHFETLLAGIVANPDQRLGDLPLLDEAERRQLLVDWTDTGTDYPVRCIHDLFAEQAAKTPEAVALISRDQQVAFAELDRRANQLAHYLQKRGVGPEVVVAVCMERSIEMIVALLGILKAGGAFVPVDPSYPAERVTFLLKDSQAPIVLTQQRILDSLTLSAAEPICLDARWAEIATESPLAPACSATPDNAAYLIYTSGSTGTPKGSISPHHASLNRFAWMWRTFPFAQGEVCCQKTSLSFADSIWENFGPLLRGIPLVIVPDDAVKDPQQLLKLLGAHGVTRIVLVPSLLRVLLEQEVNLAQKLPRLKYWTCSGESLPLELAQSFKQKLPAAVLINLYGSSEIAADVTCYEVTAPDALAGIPTGIPIGWPIDNTEAYILDGSFEPVPVGICGELYIAGAGLARGYFDHPELTAERFLANPFSREPGARMFRTGDLARYRPDGTIEFLGRADYQVKIRGFRVELGEIEAVLGQHRMVRQSVVVVHEDSSGDRRLVAYIVPFAGAKVDHQELRAFAQEKLPEYMIPSVLVELPELPLTPSGKISRRALPAPAYAAHLKQNYRAPRTEVEELLSGIWAEVLKVPRVGINDNFFELGGHSLLAVRLFARIEKLCGKHLPLATLFQAPTVARLAEALREEGWTAPWSSLVAIQAIGHNARAKRPLFCVHAVGGNVIEYHDLARHLGPDQPFYAFQSVGLDGRQAPLKSIPAMAAHYIKEMREVQPAGPYLLGGHSLGGMIAFEMACQLHEQGEQVDRLALLDAYPFGHYKLQASANSRTYVARRFAKRMKCHFDNLLHLKGKERFAYLLDKAQFAPAKIKQQLWRRAYRLRRFNRALPATLRNIEGLNFLAAREYVPRIYPGRVALFWASGDLTTSFDLLDGWRTLASGGVDVHEISGNHINIVKEPHVRALADDLRACLISNSCAGVR